MNSPNIDYKNIISSMRLSKRLGQNFLINKKVAKTEANFGTERTVLELGPGLGMLTRELCRVAKKVIAVERDNGLCEFLKENLKNKKLELISDDFFKIEEHLSADIMISNIPYSLSSKVVGWLGSRQLPGVLCVQKEFANHMVAAPSSRNYSKLSVFCALQFNVTYILDVPANDFYPVPRVGSSLVYLKPKMLKVDKRSYEVLSLLMMHKKKKLRNSLVDSSRLMGIEKEKAMAIARDMPNKDGRAFQLAPEELLKTSDYIVGELDD